ncbi:MAG: hypothetical protein ABFD64_08680 [Armatimonadota bacterium]
MENDNKQIYTIRKPRRLRPALIGCSVFVVAVVIFLTVVLASFYKTTYAKDLTECRINIEKVGDAIERYYTKQDAYPDSLNDLVPDYLPASALHCPADKSAKDSISYVYIKPDSKSPAEFIMLSCSHHEVSGKMKSKFPGAILQYRKDGNITMAPVTDYQK